MANKVANPILEWKFIESVVKCMIICPDVPGKCSMMFFSKRLILRDAVEVPVGAEKNLPVGDSGRRVARFAQIIHRQNLQLRRVGAKDSRDASSARDIQPPSGRHDRSPAFAAFEPLDPPNFSC